MDEQPGQAPAGWYHAGGGILRWWDGRAWTEHVAHPTPAARPARQPAGLDFVIGVVLVMCFPLALMLSVFALIGDSFPVSRVGVAADPAGLAVVSAVCPRERLQEVSLVSRSESGEYELLWRLAGDAPLPEWLPLGAAPAGMATTTALGRAPTAVEQLTLRVVTSELTSSYDMEFTLADVPVDGVLSFGSVYRTDDAFRRAAIDDRPCGDPDGKDAAGRLAGIVLIVGAVAAAIGGALIARSRGRRSTPEPDPPLPVGLP